MTDRNSRFALGSFAADDRTFLGILRGEEVLPVATLDSGAFPSGVTLLDLLKDWKSSMGRLTTSFDRAGSQAHRLPLDSLRVMAPLPDARQVFCTGANYRDHVVEMVVAVGLGSETQNMDADKRRIFGESFVARQIETGEPYIFMKPVSSISGPFDHLTLPAFSDQVDWEIELGVVLGCDAFGVCPERAMECVAGYMVVNDITARDKVRRIDPGAIGPDWVAAKGAPRFLTTGPYFVPAQFVPEPTNLSMRLKVNGETMQDSNTCEMTFCIARQIAYVSRFSRMLAGDILCTGSPAGNGVARDLFLKPGDVMEAEIEGLGRQIVQCVSDPAQREMRPPRT